MASSEDNTISPNENKDHQISNLQAIIDAQVSQLKDIISERDLYEKKLKALSVVMASMDKENSDVMRENMTLKKRLDALREKWADLKKNVMDHLRVMVGFLELVGVEILNNPAGALVRVAMMGAQVLAIVQKTTPEETPARDQVLV